MNERGEEGGKECVEKNRRGRQWEGWREGGREGGQDTRRDSVTNLSSSWYSTVLNGSGSDRISMDSLTAMILKGKGVCSRSSVHCAASGSMESSSATLTTLGWSDTKTSMRVLASSTEAAMSLLLCCPKASGWSV